MFKLSALFKKSVLVILVMAIGLAIFPLTSVSAASLIEQTAATAFQPNNSRLERLWVREQSVYQREGNLLSKAGGFIAKTQALIDKANQKGWDTSTLQAALNAFAAIIPAAQAAHENGAAIVTNHAGFDANGKVTDRATAIVTAKSLAQVLQDTRTAINGTGKALRLAVRAFRQAHRNTGTSTP
jgi:hypothetical protein